MERIGLNAVLIGVVVAMAGTIPFLITVVSNATAGQDFAGQLAWQGFALGGVIAIVGLVLTMLGENKSGRRHPTV